MNYFAYGSNMSSEELQAWCPNAAFVSIARLPNHRLDFTRYSEKRKGGVADIVPSEGDDVWGVLYELPTEALPALDRKEGVARGAYRRAHVGVELPSGEHVRAMTYVVVEKEPPQPPSDEYLNHLLVGAREWNLPAEYVAKLERIKPRASRS